MRFDFSAYLPITYQYIAADFVEIPIPIYANSQEMQLKPKTALLQTCTSAVRRMGYAENNRKRTLS